MKILLTFGWLETVENSFNLHDCYIEFQYLLNIDLCTEIEDLLKQENLQFFAPEAIFDCPDVSLCAFECV